MVKFFNRLNYSFGNEDWRTEEKALKVKPDDRILCITASGDRPLNLLLNDCHEIIAIDMNPLQNHLLKLKAAAMKAFDFRDYLKFLGTEEESQRKQMLQSLMPFLNAESAHFWMVHQKKVQKGILYQGAIEKWTKAIALFVKTFRKDKQKRLFRFEDLEQQRRFIQQDWATPSWRKAFEMVLNPFVSRFLLKDPGLHEHLDQSLHVGRYIHDRMNKSLEKGLARENLLISLILTGKVLPEGYPPYLTEKGTQKIRKQLSKLNVVNGNVIEYLESAPDSSIDAFSLSDVSSYLSPANFERLIHGIARTAKPGARFCLRQFLSNHRLPPSLGQIFKRDAFLEDQLEEEDRCFVYRFMAGTIKK